MYCKFGVYKHGKLDQKVGLSKKKYLIFFFKTKTQENRLNFFNFSFRKHICFHWVYGKLSTKFEKI